MNHFRFADAKIRAELGRREGGKTKADKKRRPTRFVRTVALEEEKRSRYLLHHTVI